MTARGPGRPRMDEAATAKNLVVRATQADRDELACLVVDGRAGNQSEAVRYLIRESAKRRAKRAR